MFSLFSTISDSFSTFVSQWSFTNENNHDHNDESANFLGDRVTRNSSSKNDVIHSNDTCKITNTGKMEISDSENNEQYQNIVNQPETEFDTEKDL